MKKSNNQQKYLVSEEASTQESQVNAVSTDEIQVEKIRPQSSKPNPTTNDMAKVIMAPAYLFGAAMDSILSGSSSSKKRPAAKTEAKKEDKTPLMMDGEMPLKSDNEVKNKKDPMRETKTIMGQELVSDMQKLKLEEIDNQIEENLKKISDSEISATAGGDQQKVDEKTMKPSESEATLKKKWTTEDHRKMIDKNMCDMFETVLTPATVMGSSMSKFFDPKAARDKAEQQWIQQQIKIADENAARIAAEEEEDLMGLVDHN